MVSSLKSTLHKFGYENVVSAHRHPNGGGWVADTAEVADTAYVHKTAKVFDNAKVLDHAVIAGKVKVMDNAIVKDGAHILDRAWISGNAIVKDKAVVKGEGTITGSSVISGNAIVQDKAEVSDGAIVSGNCILSGRVFITGEDGQVTVTDNAMIGGHARLIIKRGYFGNEILDPNVGTGSVTPAFREVHSYAPIILPRLNDLDKTIYHGIEGLFYRQKRDHILALCDRKSHTRLTRTLGDWLSAALVYVNSTGKTKLPSDF